MEFDLDNHVIQCCARGMELEGQGKADEAGQLFDLAWAEASNDFERSVAAHYVARHQKNISEKLKWDEIALACALQSTHATIKTTYPSLYLNIAKCYEDLADIDNAKKHYQLALSYTHYLPDDGYGKMIKAGILNGIERVDAHS